MPAMLLSDTAYTQKAPLQSPLSQKFPCLPQILSSSLVSKQTPAVRDFTTQPVKASPNKVCATCHLVIKAFSSIGHRIPLTSYRSSKEKSAFRVYMEILSIEMALRPWESMIILQEECIEIWQEGPGLNLRFQNMSCSKKEKHTNVTSWLISAHIL